MKISALKKMIHEEVRRAVRAELKELLNSNPAPQPRQSEPSGIEEIRTRFKASQPGHPKETYRDLSEPKNEKTIVNGEHFASGNGVLDWFKQTKDETALNEHAAALKKSEKIDEYVNQIVGKGRI